MFFQAKSAKQRWIDDFVLILTKTAVEKAVVEIGLI
jgi:hypothetical protein